LPRVIDKQFGMEGKRQQLVSIFFFALVAIFGTCFDPHFIRVPTPTWQMMDEGKKVKWNEKKMRKKVK